jgi:hypothetical protein
MVWRVSKKSGFIGLVVGIGIAAMIFIVCAFPTRGQTAKASTIHAANCSHSDGMVVIDSTALNGWNAGGSQVADPLLVMGKNTPTLSSASTAINKGNETYGGKPEHDITRYIRDNLPDVGEYEYNSGCLIASPHPRFAIRLNNDSFIEFNSPSSIKNNIDYYSNQYVDAEIKYIGNNQWSLNILNKNMEIKEVWFPWQPEEYVLNPNIMDDIIFYPYLFGTAELAASRDAYEWSGNDYPGTLMAPLIVISDVSKAKIVAAVNWPPKKVTPLWSLNRISMRYNELISPGSNSKFMVLIAEETASSGEKPWQKALDNYKFWLSEKMSDEGVYPIRYPEWMKNIDGWMNVQLENMQNFSTAELGQKYGKWKSIFPWIQFWGQMSDYGDGCCVDNKFIHGRYYPMIIDYAEEFSNDGSHVGYYSRPRSPYGYLDDPEIIAGETNLEFLLDWINKNKSWNANAFYIDVLGARYFGDPLFIVNLFKDEKIPRDTVIEYPVDIYPTAFLASGSIKGGFINGGPDNPVESLSSDNTKTTFINFGRYILDDRIVFLGESNGDHEFWGTDNNYWAERQVFLLGAKFDAIHIEDSDSRPDSINRAIDLTISQRQRVNWWKRGLKYLDTKGISNKRGNYEIRRFIDKDNFNVFAIDNWDENDQVIFDFLGEKIEISIPINSETGKPYRLYIHDTNGTEPLPSDYEAIKVDNVSIDGILSEFIHARSISFSDASERGGSKDNSATHKIMWDYTNLYIGIEVTDTELNAIFTGDDNTNLYTDDAVEIFIDPDNDRGNSMESDDYRYIINLKGNVLDGNGYLGWNWDGHIIGKVNFSGTLNHNSDTDSGYTIEAAIPWVDLGITVNEGHLLGLQIGITDKDVGASYESFGWPITGTNFDNPDGWAEVELVRGSSYEKEDINQDGSVDITDLQLCINVILCMENDPVIIERSDMNGDGRVNVLDVQWIALVLSEE